MSEWLLQESEGGAGRAGAVRGLALISVEKG